MSDNPKLTIGIITCGRPQKINKCLESIQKNVKFNHSILVVDSKITSENLDLYKSITNLKYLTFSSPISPSAARKIVSENVQTPYILFLDDDIQVTSGSVLKTLEYLETHPEVDIVGGSWLENGQFRELGQYFHFGTAENKKVIYKSFLSMGEAEQLKLESVQADGIQATMLVRKNILDKVNFDARYDFYFELFDFFLQCKQHKIRVDVLANAIFEHYPGAYTTPTLRQESDRENDRQKFFDKWGFYPIGVLGMPRQKLRGGILQKLLQLVKKHRSPK